jgi:drug/metabolite transporter (DMT)-like permease
MQTNSLFDIINISQERRINLEKTNKKSAYVAAFLYAIIVGLSFLFTKIALSISNPIDILAYRFISSFIAVSIPVLLKLVPVNFNKERILKLLPLAILYPLCFFGFQTFGLQYATSSEAGIILASAPIFTMIMASHFLGEESNIYQKISIAVSLVGVLYITFKKGATIDLANIKGMILLLMSALCFSGYSILARKLTKDYTTIELSFIMITISFVVFTLMAIIKNISSGTIAQFLVPLKSIKFIISILYLGVISTLGTSLLTNYALSKLEASKIIVFSNLGTVISIIAGVIFLKEEIFYYHIIGSLLIVTGVLGTNFLDKKELS